jgi:hypothetical protein
MHPILGGCPSNIMHVPGGTRDSVGLSSRVLQGQGGVFFCPLKPHDDGPSRWGGSSTIGGRVMGSQVSFTMRRDCSSCLILVAIILSSVTHVVISISLSVCI